MFSEYFFKYLFKNLFNDFFEFKRYVSTIALLLFIMSGLCPNGIYAKAAVSPQAQIYADDIVIKAGDSAEVPVFIKNNPGMMGWLIITEYDSEKIEIESVRAGNLSANGVFDYNTSPEHADSALILWSYTKEVAGDGTLFWLDIRAKKNLGTDKTVIRLKCSEEDTFNEKYETVSPECIPIEISGGGKTVVKPPEESAGVRTESPEAEYQGDSDNSKTAQSGKNEQTWSDDSAENGHELSSKAQAGTLDSAQNEASKDAQTAPEKAMKSDTPDAAQSEQSVQPGQSEKTDGISDDSRYEQTDAAGEHDADENANRGKDADEGEVETIGGKTIVIDDVIKSGEDDEKEDWFKIICTVAVHMVFVGVPGVVWWKMRKIKGRK